MHNIYLNITWYKAYNNGIRDKKAIEHVSVLCWRTIKTEVLEFQVYWFIITRVD